MGFGVDLQWGCLSWYLSRLLQGVLTWLLALRCYLLMWYMKLCAGLEVLVAGPGVLLPVAATTGGVEVEVAVPEVLLAAAPGALAAHHFGGVAVEVLLMVADHAHHSCCQLQHRSQGQLNTLGRLR